MREITVDDYRMRHSAFAEMRTVTLIDREGNEMVVRISALCAFVDYLRSLPATPVTNVEHRA